LFRRAVRRSSHNKKVFATTPDSTSRSDSSPHVSVRWLVHPLHCQLKHDSDKRFRVRCPGFFGQVFAHPIPQNHDRPLPMTHFPTIVLGSRNKKKIGEIGELLDPFGIELLGVSEFPEVADVVEDGDSFAANAGKKATEVALALNRWVLAEDSGLCVDALGGAPGIFSARYAGEHGADGANNEKLLQELAAIPTEKRTAHYVCYAVLADPTGRIRLSAEGRCGGRILTEYRGDHGFGYDPLFLVREYHQSFGQLTAAVKRHISHRAKAFERLIPQIIRLFEQMEQ
jgi:XTP/dITP diphosphohydrolase